MWFVLFFVYTFLFLRPLANPTYLRIGICCCYCYCFSPKPEKQIILYIIFLCDTRHSLTKELRINETLSYVRQLIVLFKHDYLNNVDAF